jgi:hypothetical protein
VDRFQPGRIGTAVQGPDAVLNEEEQMKRAVIGCTLALGLVLGSAVSAQAGEVTGNGKPVPAPDHAKSLCVYSGKDTPDTIEGTGPDGQGDDALNGVGNTQNYGIFVRAGLKAIVPSPGVACNPTKGFAE